MGSCKMRRKKKGILYMQFCHSLTLIRSQLTKSCPTITNEKDAYSFYTPTHILYIYKNKEGTINILRHTTLSPLLYYTPIRAYA